MKKGANINLYGFEGNDCIYKAYGSGNLRVLNYLFEHGIRNDLNSFLFYFDEPEWYVNSNTYDSCSTNVNLREWDVENQKQIISVLERNDCRYWIKNWNEEELKKYSDNLYNWMRSNGENQ